MSRLQQLREMRDPSLRMDRVLREMMMAETIRKMDMVKGEKGDPGHTPVKGVDYFTAEEVSQIIAYVQSQVKNGKDGKDGLNGFDGYAPIKGVDYFDGETPKKGVHYWTPSDISTMVAETVKRLPKQNAVTAADVISEIKKNPFSMKDLGDYEDIKDLPQLIKFLKRGGFRGGAGTATSAVVTILTTPSTVNDTNKDFTFSSKPTIVYVNGNGYREGAGWTWNAGTLTATLDSAAGVGGDVWAV